MPTPLPLITLTEAGSARYYLCADDWIEGLDSIASLHAGLTAHGYSAPVATLLIGAANVMSFAIRDDDFQKQIKRVEE